MRSLIAYYSRRGQNLVDGEIRTLFVGNTELAAAILQKFTGADIYRIEPIRDYPEDYCQCIDLARQDLLRRNRPKLKKNLTAWNNITPFIWDFPTTGGLCRQRCSHFWKALILEVR